MKRVLVVACIVLALPAAGGAAAPGDRLLFTQHAPLPRHVSTFFVCASAPDGIRPVRVVEMLSLWHAGFAVSDDGSRVAWSNGSHLHVAAVEGTSSVRVGFGSQPVWTPDGTHIVYTGPRGLQMIRPDGSGETVLATSGAWPAVSPDGRAVAFVRGEHLILLDTSGGAERTVLSRPGIAAPDWAPDGSRIVFTIAGAVHSIAPDGTGMRALTNGSGDSEPAYSPAGTHIAFERGDDIWLMTASGGDPVNVTHSPLPEGAPDWQAATAAKQAGTDRPCVIFGTEGDDHLVGSEYGDFIYDLGGDDTVRGLGGDDHLFDGPGDDRIDGGDGRDAIVLASGSNVVHGGDGNDSIYGSGLYQCCVLSPQGSSCTGTTATTT